VSSALPSSENPAAENPAQLDTPASVRPSNGVRLALFALNIYKAYLSPHLVGTCRYTPTCSRYAYEAVERFGVARGSWLALKRLGRCQPLSKRFGYDPVPEKWENMSSNSSLPADSHEVHS
jgi:uncharacterized protein